MSVQVLLIDDDQDFLAILSERLMIRDMDVTTVSSAVEAFALVESRPFDAIILDLQMPEMDGLQALERFKAINPDLQIILLTGHATVAKGVQAMKLGAADVLEKPVDIRVLTEKIKKTLVQRTSGQRSGEQHPTVPSSDRGMSGSISRLIQGIQKRFRKN
jgi:DNA-binding NtrC family response regulator